MDKSNTSNDYVQPERYTEEELKRLKESIEEVKNDDTRSTLACWGNHHDYTRGW